MAHTFIAGTVEYGPSGVFDSGLALAGSSFEYTADTVGEIPHYCIVHPWMAGLIVVQDAAAGTMLRGTAFADADADGTQDPGEPGRAGLTVLYVDMADWSKTSRTTTDSSGTYTFDIPAGDYLVQLEGVPAEEILTGHAYLTVPAGMTTVQDFTLRATSSEEEDPPDNVSLLQMIKDLIQRIEALETPAPEVVCPAGQVSVDGTCTDVVCPIGYSLRGAACQPIQCDRGYELDRSTNTCKFAGCPSWYVLEGNRCVVDTTDYHIITDKQVYSFGDVIKVSGRVNTTIVLPPPRIDGTESVVTYKAIWTNSDVVKPELYCENPGETDGNVDLDGWYEDNPQTENMDKPCTINFDESTGEFSFEFPVDNGLLQAGEYGISLSFGYGGKEPFRWNSHQHTPGLVSS